ncbi:MAG: alanine racemase C-terminal domain-containing protein, partial [Bacteroidota bacterium]
SRVTCHDEDGHASRVTCQEGDEVIIFSDQHPVTELAEAIGTIPYEVLTGISRRVKRIYYYE